MKYLKLITDKSLPKYLDKETHITFAYYGKILVTTDFLQSFFEKSELRCFFLRKKREDMFGQNKDIPVVVYDIDVDIDVDNKDNVNNNVNSVRLKLLNESGITEQNFPEYTPHISNVSYEDAPDVIKVIGVGSNDDTFNYMFDRL